MTVVKLDRRGRILLTKNLRKALELQGGDHLVAKPVNGDKIILEKPAKSHRNKVEQEDTLVWLLEHPAKIPVAEDQEALKKERIERVLESWKEELWSGE